MVDADAAQREAAEREARAHADGAQARTDAQAHETERARLAATLTALRAQDSADAVLRSRAADLDRLADEEAAIADVVARADRDETAALALLATRAHLRRFLPAAPTPTT
jgi:hypothetical protein